MSSVASRYDALFLDLDGVVYRGEGVIPAAAEALQELRRAGARVAFLTNNSSRTPDEVAETLQRMGVQALPGEILTSAVATAAMLRRQARAGSTAFVIGERGIREALTAAGIEVRDPPVEATDLVVVGWDRSVDYDKLRTAALLVERGAQLVATNSDASYPAPDGLWPGAGAILAAVTTTTRATATVVGKPNRPLFEAAAEAADAQYPLVVGDRLDTDIAGAAGMGWDSLFVLSGAHVPADLLWSRSLPTYVGADLCAVLEDRPAAKFGPARPQDRSEIETLLTAAGLSPAGVNDRMGQTLVSRSSGHVDATACLQPLDGAGVLRSVATREDLRGRGLGFLAVAAAVAMARDQGVRTLSLFTQTAPGFFERLGFRTVARADLPDVVAGSSHATEECAASATPMVLEVPAEG
jgi:glycerol-1-phosphatase